MRIGTHYGRHLFRCLAQVVKVFSGNAELDGEADWRPVFKAQDPHPGIRQAIAPIGIDIGKVLFQPFFQIFARLQILGNDNELGKVVVE